MPIQYGGANLPIRSGAATAGFGPAFQRKPKPARQTTAKPKPAPVSQTLAQVANQRVQQQLQPQIAAQNAFNAHQNAAIQSFAQALLGKLQPVAGQVGQAYDQAIGQQQALSGQAAQFLSAANPTGQVADLLRSANAPAQQQEQIAGQLGQTFGGGAGVLAFTGGAIPGGQMAAEKAAMVGQAAQLPGLAALQGQQDLASALSAQRQSRQELEATRPALYQQAAQDTRTTNVARARAAEEARRNEERARQNAIGNRFKAAGLGQDQAELTERQRQFDVTQQSKNAAADFLNWYRTQGLELDEAQVNQRAAEFGVTSQQRQQGLDISAQNAATAAARAQADLAPKYSASVSRSLGVRSDQYGNPQLDAKGRPILLPGFKIDKNGQVVKTTTASGNKAKTRSLTAGQLRSTTAEINNTVNGLRTGGEDPETGEELPALSREDALAFLRDQGYLSSPQLARIAVAALNRVYGQVAAAKSDAATRAAGGFGVQAQVTP